MSFNDEVDLNLGLVSSEEINGCKMIFEKKFICSFCTLEVESEEELISHCSAHRPSFVSHSLNGNQIAQEELWDGLIDYETESCTEVRLTTDDVAMQIDVNSLVSPYPESQQVGSHKQCSENIIFIENSSQPKRKKIPLKKRTVFTCPICNESFFCISDCDNHFAIDHRKKKHQRQRLISVVKQRSFDKMFTRAELNKVMEKLSRPKKLLKKKKRSSPEDIPDVNGTVIMKEQKDTFTIDEEKNSTLEEELFVVEKILDKRIHNNEIEYLVKWLGYPFEDNTWEPTENFNSLSAIKEYEENILKQDKALLPNEISEDCCYSSAFKNISSQVGDILLFN